MAIEDSFPEFMRRNKMKRDCMGRANKAHTPIIVKHPFHSDVPCGWSRMIGQKYWYCYHEIRCSECEKVLDDELGMRCPDYLTYHAD